MDDKLINFLSELLCVDYTDLTPDSDLLKICIFDYTEFFDIIYSVEKHFNVSILEDDMDDIEHIRTIEKLNDFIKNRSFIIKNTQLYWSKYFFNNPI